jgi:ribonuclease HII
MKTNKLYAFESKFKVKGYKHIAGVDEAGRGPWAGPLVVAAVILPSNYRNDEINDSKLLPAKKREQLFEIIRKVALSYAIVFIAPKEVDDLNPKQAAILGMKKAIAKLSIRPDLVLIDAERINIRIKSKSIIKGDQKALSIAAASILAKVARDRYMTNIDALYPQYHFKKHKGYGTSEHMKALDLYGPIVDFHRFSYKPIQLNLAKFKFNR